MIDDPKTITVKTSEGYARIILDALSEVESSTEKHGDQRYRPLGLSKEYGTFADSIRDAVNKGMADGTVTWAAIIAEEFAEAISEEDALSARAELVQVLAVVMKAIDAIDSRAEEARSALSLFGIEGNESILNKVLAPVPPAPPVAAQPICGCSCHTTPGTMHVAACCGGNQE